jgi:putative ABC transport system substrate-binding protein
MPLLVGAAAWSLAVLGQQPDKPITIGFLGSATPAIYGKAARSDRSADAAHPRRRGDRMRRREFMTLVGGAAVAWPLAARTQQPAIPAIGYLNTRGAGEDEHLLAAFHQGLEETGYVENQNVRIEYRWAEGRNDRLPALAADLVSSQVAVIAAGGTPPTIAAKAATATIPIVFVTGADPVEIGLVASLNRPGGNLTGITTLTSKLAQKKLELLHDLLPTAAVIALLINPTNPILAETNRRDVQAAAGTLGLQIFTLRLSSEREFETAFATLAQQRAGRSRDRHRCLLQ